MADVRFPGTLCLDHETAGHRAPAETRALTARARLEGWGGNGLRRAVALLALATRRQQAHTGGPPRGWGRTPGPPEPPPRSKPSNLSCRQQSLAGAFLFQKDPIYRDKWKPHCPSPSAREGSRKSRLLFYKVSCSAVWEGQFWGCTQVEVKEKLRRREGKGEERGQERSEVGTRWPQARGAPGPGHISVRMSMRLFSPER